MHELSLINDLMRKIESIAREQNARHLTRVNVRLGALTHLSAEHFREHFEHAAAGTPAAGAKLFIEMLTDQYDPLAQEIILESVELESGK